MLQLLILTSIMGGREGERNKQTQKILTVLTEQRQPNDRILPYIFSEFNDEWGLNVH